MQPRLAIRLTLLWLICFAFAGEGVSERLPLRVYTSADGLGSSFVDSLMRDSRGFMWFCTRDWLSRFDGARFITYRIGDKNSPPGIETLCLPPGPELSQLPSYEALHPAIVDQEGRMTCALHRALDCSFHSPRVVAADEQNTHVSPGDL